MKKTLCYAVAFAILGVAACRNAEQKSIAAPTGETKTKHMNNLISIAEIPVSDFRRAVAFYQDILGVSIEEMDMQGTQMGILPNEEGSVNVVLAKGPDYKPTSDGAVLYLQAGKDLQSILDKIEPAGGKVLVPKTQISAEMGFFALFLDTEGNKLGLHSSH